MLAYWHCSGHQGLLCDVTSAPCMLRSMRRLSTTVQTTVFIVWVWALSLVSLVNCFLHFTITFSLLTRLADIGHQAGYKVLALLQVRGEQAVAVLTGCFTFCWWMVVRWSVVSYCSDGEGEFQTRSTLYSGVIIMLWKTLKSSLNYNKIIHFPSNNSWELSKQNFNQNEIKMQNSIKKYKKNQF